MHNWIICKGLYPECPTKYLFLYYSVFVRNLTGRQVENQFCTVLYRFLHLLQARPAQARRHFQSPKFHLCGRVSRAAESGCRYSLV